MTDQELLDMFACMAMQGQLASCDNEELPKDITNAERLKYKTFGELIAGRSYRFAELLLAERKKRYFIKI